MLLGEHNYNSDTETNTLRMGITMIKNHPNYNDGTLDNDFSMLKLKSEVDYCSYPHIRPICLPTDTSDNYAGDKAIVTGWGYTSVANDVSNKLMEVEVYVKTNDQCKNKSEYSSSQITSAMLCANFPEGGDSGSSHR